MPNNNKCYFNIINRLQQSNLIQNDLILPSLVKMLTIDFTIRPFWNDKIQKLSDKLFLPSTNNIKQSNEKINI